MKSDEKAAIAAVAIVAALALLRFPQIPMLDPSTKKPRKRLEGGGGTFGGAGATGSWTTGGSGLVALAGAGVLLLSSGRRQR